MAVSFREMVDEKGSRCRRRLHPLERDHVEDALVALVSYARDDGQREVGYVLGEGQRVEAAHVGSGTTATDDHHGVEVVGPVKDVVQCPDDAVLDLLALHDSRKERVGEVETVVVVVKLIAEVTESGGLFTGDDRDMLGEEWELQLSLQVEDTFFLELSDDLLPFAGHVAHRVGGVDILHNP